MDTLAMQQRAPLGPIATRRPSAAVRPAAASARPRHSSTLQLLLPQPVLRQHRSRRAQPCRALWWPSAAPLPPPPPPVPLATTYLFAASTLYTIAVALLMTVLPRWRPTQRLLDTPLVLAPLAAAYGVLLLQSWSPDTVGLILPGSWEAGLSRGWNPQFLPSLPGICTLFSRVTTAASLWVHLLAVNLFAARSAYLEGLQAGVPTWHSTLLCVTLAPLGLLSHAVTKAAFQRLKSRPAE